MPSSSSSLSSANAGPVFSTGGGNPSAVAGSQLPSRPTSQQAPLSNSSHSLLGRGQPPGLSSRRREVTRAMPPRVPSSGRALAGTGRGNLASGGGGSGGALTPSQPTAIPSAPTAPSLSVHEGTAAGPWSTRFKDRREQRSITERPSASGTAGPSSTAAPLSARPLAGLTTEEASDRDYIQRASAAFEKQIDKRANELSYLPSEFRQKLFDLKEEAIREYLRESNKLSTQASNRSDLSRTYVSQCVFEKRNELKRKYFDKLNRIANSVPRPESTKPQRRIVGFDSPSSSPP